MPLKEADPETYDVAVIKPKDEVYYNIMATGRIEGKQLSMFQFLCANGEKVKR